MVWLLPIGPELAGSAVRVSDLPTGAMRNLERFLDAVVELGTRLRQDFAPECAPILDGRMHHDGPGLCTALRERAIDPAVRLLPVAGDRVPQSCQCASLRLSSGHYAVQPSLIKTLQTDLVCYRGLIIPGLSPNESNADCVSSTTASTCSSAV